MHIEQTFEEHISGAKRNGERAVLSECINYAISNRIGVVLFSELSRCGRAVWEILETIKTLKDSNINAYFQKEGLSLFSSDGKEICLLKYTWTDRRGFLRNPKVCRRHPYNIKRNLLAQVNLDRQEGIST